MAVHYNHITLQEKIKLYLIEESAILNYMLRSWKTGAQNFTGDSNWKEYYTDEREEETSYRN